MRVAHFQNYNKVKDCSWLWRLLNLVNLWFYFVFKCFILFALVFRLHLHLCEGVESLGAGVIDSWELPTGVLGIEPKTSGRAASHLNC